MQPPCKDRRPPLSTRQSGLFSASPPSLPSLPLSSNGTTPRTRPSRLGRNASFLQRPHHRHSKDAEDALELLRVLAEQSERRGGEDGVVGEDQGIIANLEAYGWVYHGEQSGVRIFSKEDSGGGELGGGDGAPSERGTGTGTVRTGSMAYGSGESGRGRVKQGIRAHESLPFFRGEAFVEGSWRVEDVAATVRSLGARAVWDPRFDPLRSKVVAALSETDALLHLYLGGTFPVGDRDASVLVTHFEDTESKTAYVAARSVEDPLIPKKGMRTTVHLNGYAFRAVPHSPYFDPPPTAPPPSEAALPPTRPAHRRAKSSVSGLAGPGPPLLSRRPPSIIHQRSASVASNRALPYASSSVNETPFEYTLSRNDPSVAASTVVSQHPGVHISFVAKSSPGGNLPQTYVNQLSLSLPLSLAHIDRYLHAHGFPPYVERHAQRGGLDILDESYDVAGGIYTLVYRAHESIASEDTRIRFFGSAFSRGNFAIEVFRAKDWRLEYDVEPALPPETAREADDPADTTLPKGRRRSSLSVMSSPGLPAASPRHPTPAAFSFPFHPTPPSQDPPPPTDFARLPGPAGGCTIIIPNASCAGLMPVTVIIRKNAAAARASIRTMLGGGSLARAAECSEQGVDTIEELLGGEEQEAEMALQSARAVLKQLRREKGDEARTVPPVAATGLGLNLTE